MLTDKQARTIANDKTFAIAFLNEYRQQLLDMLDALTELKIFDNRYDAVYGECKDVSFNLWFLVDTENTTGPYL